MKPITNPIGLRFICIPDAGTKSNYKDHAGHTFTCTNISSAIEDDVVVGKCDCGEPWVVGDEEIRMYWHEVQLKGSKLERLKKLIRETK